MTLGIWSHTIKNQILLMPDFPFISICIPSYNRPEGLLYLLNSIDLTLSEDLEVVICEDNSPRREEVREALDLFKSNAKFKINYFENEQNLGYDRNLRELITKAKGKFIIFMGDDDAFDKNSLGNFVDFLKKNSEVGYVMKTHTFIHEDGKEELFKYFDHDTFYDPSEQTVALLFRKSVFISGFTFRRSYALPFLTDEFDGTLLYQIYLLSELCLNHPSAYCTIPLTVQSANRRDVPMFGSSESEKNLYEPGVISVDNSINFMKGFFKISQFIDIKYGLTLTYKIRNDISKYSYPILSIQRNKGIKVFLDYVKRLRTEINIGQSIYFKIYTIGLILFGTKFCNLLIILIKKVLGKTPQL